MESDERYDGSSASSASGSMSVEVPSAIVIVEEEENDEEFLSICDIGIEEVISEFWNCFRSANLPVLRPFSGSGVVRKFRPHGVSGNMQQAALQ